MPRANFYDNVYAAVKRVPRGKVATYGQIAALCGFPRAARQVGWALHALDGKKSMGGVPWQRVVNREGRISTTCQEHGTHEQAALLTKEGVEVKRKEGFYWINLKKYLWEAKA